MCNRVQSVRDTWLQEFFKDLFDLIYGHLLQGFKSLKTLLVVITSRLPKTNAKRSLLYRL